MTLTSAIQLTTTSTELAANDLQSIRTSLTYTQTTNLADGTGNDQANVIFSDTRTLAASGTEDLDLAGVLTNSRGLVMTFTKIKGLIIKAASGNTNDVQVTRPASNGVPVFLAASDGVPVKPNGMFILTAPGAGITVTAATGDLLTITNSAGGTGVTYDVIIIGVGTLA